MEDEGNFQNLWSLLETEALQNAHNSALGSGDVVNRQRTKAKRSATGEQCITL